MKGNGRHGSLFMLAKKLLKKDRCIPSFVGIRPFDAKDKKKKDSSR